MGKGQKGERGHIGTERKRERGGGRGRYIHNI